MAVSERIGRHLRANVVGYVALFVALSGTAVAIPGHDNVKSKNLATGAVKSKAIAKGAVKSSKLQSGAVNNQALASGAISSTKLAAGAVVTNTLGNSAVTTAKIADDAVTRQKVLQGSINGGKLANGSVDSAKVNNASLLAEDFAAGQLSDGFVLSPSGQFTVQRAGRLFAIATFVPTCGGSCTFTVRIDGTDVPGAGFTGTPPPGQLTLIGVAPIAAGTHTIDLQATGGSAATVTLGGILLQ